MTASGPATSPLASTPPGTEDSLLGSRTPISLGPDATLFTFPPSSGCETIIWLLKLYGVEIDVDSQTAPFFLLAIRRAGGKTYPYLRIGDRGWNTSRDISQALESLVPADRSLYPQDPDLRAATEREWTTFFNPKLGNAVPNWVYYWLLPHRRLLFGPLTKGVPWWQRAIVFIFYRSVAGLISKALGIGKDIPEEARSTIFEVFDRADELLADGRAFLMGDKMTLLDVGFAAMAAPAVLEPRYGLGGLLPSPTDVPESMAATVHELRARPAGRFIAKMYRDFR